MDIGTQALPGPTLAFNVDLRKGSPDVELLKDVVTPSSWKRPQTSLRRTREKLMNLLNAFGPRPEVAPPNLRVRMFEVGDSQLELCILHYTYCSATEG